MALNRFLDHSSSAHTPLLRTLINSGKNFTYSAARAVDRKGPRIVEIFESSNSELPHIGSGNFTPIGRIPRVEELCDILVGEVGGDEENEDQERTVVFFPPQEDEAADRAAAVELIKNIANKELATDGCLVDFSSPTLTALYKSSEERTEHSIFSVPPTTSILPRGYFIPLQQQNEAKTTTTLLTGTILWIIWPPTKHNLDTLQNAYKIFAKDFDAEKLNDVALELETGVSFVVTAGVTVHCSPFCPIMGLVTETAVLSKYSIVTTDSFLTLCRQIPFLKTFWRTECSPKHKQKEFGKALVDCFTIILEGEFDHLGENELKWPIKEEGPLLEVLKAWNEIKENVVGVLDREQREDMEEMWKKLVNSTKTIACLICGARDTKRSGHFVRKHWVIVDDRVEEDEAENGLGEYAAEEDELWENVAERNGVEVNMAQSNVEENDKEVNGVEELMNEEVDTPEDEDQRENDTSDASTALELPIANTTPSANFGDKEPLNSVSANVLVASSSPNPFQSEKKTNQGREFIPLTQKKTDIHPLDREEPTTPTRPKRTKLPIREASSKRKKLAANMDNTRPENEIRMDIDTQIFDPENENAPLGQHNGLKRSEGMDSETQHQERPRRALRKKRT